jgi:hypothetical protein
MSTLIVIAVGTALYFALKPDPPPPVPDQDLTTRNTSTAQTSVLTTSVDTPAVSTEESTPKVIPRETQVKNELEVNVCRGLRFDELDPSDSRTSALDWLLHEDEMMVKRPKKNILFKQSKR